MLLCTGLLTVRILREKQTGDSFKFMGYSSCSTDEEIAKMYMINSCKDARKAIIDVKKGQHLVAIQKEAINRYNGKPSGDKEDVDYKIILPKATSFKIESMDEHEKIIHLSV